MSTVDGVVQLERFLTEVWGDPDIPERILGLIH